MSLLKTLLKNVVITTQKRTETPTARRHRLLREAFTPTPLQAQCDSGGKG